MTSRFSVGAPNRTCLPRWFTAPLAVALATTLALALVGLPLAMAGWFHPPIVIPLWIIVAVLFSLVAWRHLPADDGVPSRAEHALTALVVVGAAAYAIWTGVNHGQHLIVDRDPGVYLVTGAWLGEEGNLRLDGTEGPFDTPTLRPNGAGFSPNSSDSLSPQFPHLTAVVLATASWVDDRAMLVTNAIIGGAVLLCVYAVASAFMSAFWAASAAGLLALTFPFVYFTRDTYSEPLAALLLFGGLWLLSIAWQRANIPLGCIAGALLGATCMVRIDGLLLMVPLVAVLIIEWRAAEAPGRRWALGALGSMLATATVGVLETRFYSEAYFREDLQPRLPALIAATAAAGIAAALLTRHLWRRSGASDEAPRSALKVVTAVALAGAAGVVLWAATVRPDPSGLPETSDDLPVGSIILDLLDQAETLSYRWLEWYLGRVGVAAGVVALLVLTACALLDGRYRAARPVAGVALATTLVYLVSPTITPEQVWAMRRFVAASIPGLLIALAWGADRVWGIRGGGVLRWAGPSVAVCLVGVTAFATASATSPIRLVRDGVPMLQVVNQICDVADDEPSAILVSRDNLMSITMPESLRTWCDVPTAGAGNTTNAAEVEALARAWEAEGRRLLVLSIQPEPFEGGLEGQDIELPAVALSTVEPTITRRPEALAPDRRAVKGEHSVLTPHLLVVDPAD